MPGAVEHGGGVAEVPSGTFTFLFTDLEGGRHRGHVVKSTGDGFHAVFGNAHDAIGAAMAAQLARGHVDVDGFASVFGLGGDWDRD